MSNEQTVTKVVTITYNYNSNR